VHWLCNFNFSQTKQIPVFVHLDVYQGCDVFLVGDGGKELRGADVAGRKEKLGDGQVHL
jgi:hypothetical protein